MRLRVLGSGTALPCARRSSSGYAVLPSGSGEWLLLDAGPGVFHRVAAAGIDLFSIRHIFLTHFHVDHVGDLAPIIFAKRHPALPANCDLTLHGPAGLRALYEGLRAAHGEWVEARGFRLEIDELEPGAGAAPVRAGGATVEAAPVRHGGARAVGYRVADGVGRVLAYSGDSGPCEELVALARGADLFLCECSRPDEGGVGGETSLSPPEEMEMPAHLRPSEVGRIAARAGARRVLLTHIYEAMDRPGLADAVRAHFPGEVSVADDLLEVEV